MEEEVVNMKWYVLRVMGGKENKTVTFIGGTPPDVKEIYKDANINAASV